ncbi:ammonia monooxygenase [Corynebacterium yudongzhengii]|uniref:AbrB family transcriptional regulator n=1 Tax=Corynebacterium yudongzhengii TaxID=2080740 RepID=A0A2U1T5J5_9CORY|nr:AbrB family transcriptional regulator [Corynebacterium yudongzhengii]AWB81007.1 ammonia monooxygenase [Corynebacterium yudongzhengii]PWC01252.1 AbrB family transcriptional regulator [Corynebacterium yudongzhengii]
MMRWLFVAPASVAVGALLSWLDVPAAWILGAILVSGSLVLSTGRELEVNPHFYRFARGMIGILAAVPLVGVPPGQLLGVLPAGLMVAVITVGIGIVGGLLLARSQRDISPESGVLSMLAGGASMMPAIATEVGADMRFVVLGQYLRLLAVSVTLPLVAGILTWPDNQSSALTIGGDQPWWMLLLVVTVALVGERLGRLVHLPVPSVFAPLLLTVLISWALPDGLTMAPPEALTILAFLSIGWVCGGALSVPALKAFSRNLPATIAFIVIVMAACALTAVPLVGWLDITYFEAYLATSPGALETVLALGAEGGAGYEVVGLQLIRLIMVLLVAGWLPQLLRLILRR